MWCFVFLERGGALLIWGPAADELELEDPWQFGGVFSLATSGKLSQQKLELLDIGDKDLEILITERLGQKDFQWFASHLPGIN